MGILNAALTCAALAVLYKIGRKIMATQAENQAKIDTILGVVQKIKSEVETLKAAPADQVLDFSGVDAALQEVDDLNADAAVETPAEPETPATSE